MKVYRIEHRVDRRGPYRENYYGFVDDTGWDDHTAEAGRPTPGSDGIDTEKFYNNKKLVCGFTSLKSMRRWFSKYKKWLIDHDFIVLKFKIKASDVIKGSHQCVFIPNDKFETFEITQML